MARPERDVLEDIEFLDSTQVGANEAARRTGFPNAEALERWLDRHGHRPLWGRLKGRDPVGTHDSSSTRKKARLMTTPDNHPTQLEQLLAAADQSSRARTRNRAGKIRALVDDLRSTLDRETSEDVEREKVRKDIERLERQLADAKARLRGNNTADTQTTPGPAAAEVRAWARINDVECPATGRVPGAVTEAYIAANDDQQQAS